MSRFFRFYPLSILTVAAIVFLSLFNPSKMGLNHIDIWDKTVHCIMYAAVTIVLWFEFLINNNRLTILKVLLFMILLPVLLGGILELLQQYCTPYRSGDWNDFLADIAGVAMGAVAGLLVERPLIRHLLSASGRKDAL